MTKPLPIICRFSIALYGAIWHLTQKNKRPARRQAVEFATFYWRPHGDSNPGYRRERAPLAFINQTLAALCLLFATATHAQSTPGEPVWPVVVGIECKPGQVRFEGRCLTPLPPACKPGQVAFEGRCLTPDRRPAKRWCGEDVAPPVVRDLLRVVCG